MKFLSMRKIGILFISCFLIFPSFANSEQNKSIDTQTVVITFLGDCTLGSEEHERERATSFDSYIHENGYDYPFSGVKDIIENDDLTVANLEGVFYNSEANKVSKTYNFRATTDFAAILPASSVECVTVANNHSEDYGKPGLISTLHALDDHGVSWFGTTNYSNQIYIYEKGNIRIGFISIYTSHWFNHQAELKNSMAVLKAEKCALICAVMHGGIEYDTRHDTGQEKLADWFIANGANVVVGHHPHVLQGVDIRNGATVLWSLGNFVFGGNKNMRAYQSILAQFTFSFDENGIYLGHQLNIIPAQYSGSREYNDYRPILVSGAEADAVLAAMQKDSSFQLSPYVDGVGAIQPLVKVKTKE